MAADERSSGADGTRHATVDDIHEIALSLPGVTLYDTGGKPGPVVYQVSRRSFIFFRKPEGWSLLLDQKEAILSDSSLPFFTTPHFEGHPSVLVRASRLGEMSRDDLAGFVEGAWLSRAGPRTIAKWERARS